MRYWRSAPGKGREQPRQRGFGAPKKATERDMSRSLRAAFAWGALAIVVLSSAPAPSTAWAQTVPSDIVAVLRSRHVYVADAARSRVSAEAQADLEAYANRRATSGYVLKMAVLDRPPQGFRTLGQFVEAAHATLNLGDGILIAVGTDDGGGGLSAKTHALDDATIRRLLQANLGTFAAVGYTDGLKALADALVDEIEDQRAGARARSLLVVVALALAAMAVGGWWLSSRANAWSRELAATRELRDSLYPLLRRLDDEVPYLPQSDEAQRASEAHGEGSEYYHRGTEILDELSGLSRLRSALPGDQRQRLNQASLQLSLARQRLMEASAALDRAAGPTLTQPDTTVAGGPVERLADLQPEAAPLSAPHMEDAGPRASFRECCFFCSWPLPPDRRLVGPVEVGGQRRTVTECEPHALRLQAGEVPLIRAVPEDRGLVPWFAASGYDPYRDYAPTYPYGLAPAQLASPFVDAALVLSYPALRRPSHWYADEVWDDDYRFRYWDRHERWEREQGWGEPRAAPEVPLEAGAAPEVSLGQLPTAAEAGFARYPASAQDLGGGPDRS